MTMETKRLDLDSMLGVLSGSRRQAEQRAEADERGAARAKRIGELLNDIASHEAKRARFLDVGDKPLELVSKAFDQRYGVTVDWTIYSQRTGAEYAQDEAQTIAQLQAEIDKLEAEIAELLGQASVGTAA